MIVIVTLGSCAWIVCCDNEPKIQFTVRQTAKKWLEFVFVLLPQKGLFLTSLHPFFIYCVKIRVGISYLVKVALSRTFDPKMRLLDAPEASRVLTGMSPLLPMQLCLTATVKEATQLASGGRQQALQIGR